MARISLRLGLLWAARVVKLLLHISPACMDSYGERVLIMYVSFWWIALADPPPPGFKDSTTQNPDKKVSETVALAMVRREWCWVFGYVT